MRIDKFLKVTRLTKRRETAKELCDDGDVFINGKAAKAMSEVEAGDTNEYSGYEPKRTKDPKSPVYSKVSCSRERRYSLLMSFVRDIKQNM